MDYKRKFLAREQGSPARGSMGSPARDLRIDMIHSTGDYVARAVPPARPQEDRRLSETLSYLPLIQPTPSKRCPASSEPCVFPCCRWLFR